MTQETISRAELDADQARQETTFTAQVYQLAAGLQDQMHQLRTDVQADIHQLRDEMHQMRADLQSEMHQMQADLQAQIHQLERRMFLVAAMATGLIIGAMQLD